MLAALSIQSCWPTSLPAQGDGVILGPATASLQETDGGELLLGELNCLACHQADAAVKARLSPRQSPHLGLGKTGLRLTPQYLRAFLTDPAAAKPGTTMPDLLHALTGPAKADAVDSLVHFLVSPDSPAASNALSANPIQILQGRLLYHQVGCVACHAPQEAAVTLNARSTPAEVRPSPGAAMPDQASLETSSVPFGNLAKKLTVQELARFLVNPLKVRPGGRMPSLNLSEAEATAIAMYLLREQSADGNGLQKASKAPGLDYQYFEGNFSDTTKLENAKPKTSGTVETFSLKPRKRADNMGFRFSGFVNVPADGNYLFYTASDDGSRLYLDGKLVVENDGTHGRTEKKGAIQLTAGDHPISVAYFNGGAEAALKVFYEGPALPKQEIPAAALSHKTVPMVPLQEEHLIVNPEKANRGKELFASLGCADCHQAGNPAIASILKPKPLAKLDLAAANNCLNMNSQNAPAFHLSDAQRAALRSTLAAREQLAQPLAPREQAARTIAALNCLACHSRGGSGGPTPARAEYFTVVGEADLGDEGRIPPHLTRVGGKLRPEWLREVLLNKGAARPYMATRMPQFGEANVGALVNAFERADSEAKPETPTVPAALHDANYGRKLVGTEGFSCISCHLFAQHKSLGIPAMDLTMMTRRLQKDWFHRYLLDPASLRPGTRMPGFWPDGKSSRQDILGGDADRQIDAIWAYLSRGKEGGLPPGLVQGKLELVATNEAIIYRNFIQGAGSRAIAVGFPEKANLAFDANDLRLALIWQGPFMDASRHRTGRGDGFEGPLGYNVVKMPPGAAFAILPDLSSKWPELVGKKAGYKMGGYRLDSERRPTFFYSFGNVRIEDFPVAVSGDMDASLRRTLTLQTESPVENLWFRAWIATKIEAQQDGSFLADGNLKMQFTLTNGRKPTIRQIDKKAELLVPVVFTGGKATVVEDIVW